MHVIAAKAVAFHEALLPPFKEYQKQVMANAKALAGALGAKLLGAGAGEGILSPEADTGRGAGSPFSAGERAGRESRPPPPWRGDDEGGKGRGELKGTNDARSDRLRTHVPAEGGRAGRSRPLRGALPLPPVARLASVAA